MNTGNCETESRVNGVSVTALYDTVDAIKASAELGNYEFHARNQWLDGGHTRTTVKNFFGAGSEQKSRPRPLVVESDIPALFHGGDQAMDPCEHLLAALAASITTMIVWHASVQEIHIDAIETLVDGDIDLHGCLGLDSDRQPGYQQIRATVSVDADAPDATLDSLVDLGTRFSPVFDTISRGTNVIVRRKSRP